MSYLAKIVLKSLKFPMQIALLVWSVLHTGILIMAIQVFAWCHMAYNISEDVPLLEGLATVVSGQHSCDICHFANENNPIEDRGELQIALFEIIPLFPIPSATTFKSFPSASNLSADTYSAFLPLLGSGVEPPPPKNCA